MARGRWRAGRYVKELHRRIAVRRRVDAGNDVFNVQAGVDITLADWLVLGIQYKYVNFDHADGEGLDRFRYDVTEHGPLFGAAFTF